MATVRQCDRCGFLEARTGFLSAWTRVTRERLTAGSTDGYGITLEICGGCTEELKAFLNRKDEVK